MRKALITRFKGFFNQRSLRKDVWAVFVVMTVVGIISCVIVTIGSYRGLTENAQKDSLALIRSTGAVVTGYLEDPFSVIRVVAISSEKIRFIPTDKVEDMLAWRLRVSPSFDSLMVMDKKGIVRHVAPYDPILIGKDMSKPYFSVFTHTINRDTPYLSGVYLSPLTGAPTVNIAMRNNQGVVAGSLSLKSLVEKINYIQGSSNLRISVVDSDGVFVADSDKSLVAQSVVSPDFRIIRNLKGSTNTFVTTRGDKKYLATASRLRNAGWYVIVYYDRDVIFSSVRRAVIVNVVGFVLLLLIAVGSRLMFLRILTRSVDSIIEFSKHMGDGDYRTAAQLPVYPEFIILSENLNGMRRKIDERKSALEASERKFRTIIMNIPVALGIMDISGNMVFLNPAFVELLGYNSDDIPKIRDLRYHGFPEDTCCSQAAVDFASYFDSFTEGLPTSVKSHECELVCKDGSRRHVVISSTVYEKMVYNVFIDITYRVEAEREIHELNRSLESRVAERTAQLEELNANLLVANRELEDAMNRLTAARDSLVEKEKMAVLGQLAAGIAHEINTPLGAIVSSNDTIGRNLDKLHEKLYPFYLSLNESDFRFFNKVVEMATGKTNDDRMHQRRIKAKRLNDELSEKGIGNAEAVSDLLADLGLHEDARVIMEDLRKENALKILQMVYVLWSFRMSTQIIAQASEKAAKVISSLRIYLYPSRDESPEVIDLTLTIDAVLELYYYKMRSGIKVVKTYSKVPSVECYPDRLGQVWTNLINNALYSMDYKGTIEIVVGQSEGSVVVSIVDDGPGIPENIRGFIFNSMFTTKKAGEGTGLGLDIVRRIVELHQGRIECESRPGRTIFTVTIPCRRS